VEAAKRLLASERGWRIFVAGVLSGAVVARALCILADREGGDDLQIYTYFARLVLDGENPYTAPADGPIDPDYGDNPVGELGLFAGILALWDSHTALRVVFVLADLATLALLAFAYPRSRWWKTQLMVFYAFNPLVLHAWTVSADDKTILFCLIVALLVSLERGLLIAAWIATTALGILKWLSAYFFLPLVLFTARSLGGARTAVLAGGSVLLVAVLTIPYFPDSLVPIERRRDRTEFDPSQASITKLLDAVDLYHPLIVGVFVPAALVAITLLFVMSRIDLREAVVLSIAAAFLLLPDQGVNRLVFVATPFLLIMRLTTRKLVAIWVASFVSFTAAVVASGKFRSNADDIPLGNTLTDLVGTLGSTRFVVFANAYLVVVIGLFAFDRLRGRVDLETHARALRLESPGDGWRGWYVGRRRPSAVP
jgi:hypothetical protein